MEKKTVRVSKVQSNTKKWISDWFVSDPFDMTFFVMVLIVLAIGLIMLFSASYAYAWYDEGDSFFYIKRQAVFAAIGFAAMLFISKLDFKKFKKFVFLIYAVAIVLLIAVLVVGVGDGVEKRWIYVGFNLQPSEIAKLAVIMMLAMFLSTNQKSLKKPVQGILFPVAIIGLPALLILMEPHLSGTILVLVVGVAMMIVAGCHLGWIGGLTAVGGAGLVGVALSVPYMKSRVDIFLNPGSDPQGAGYQILQSLYAIGSGGLTGQGIGQSRQKYLYVSMPQNDCIFSIVAEELGFIGCLIILGLFVFLIYKGFMIALRCPDRFGSLMVFGIMTRLAVQVLLNMAVVTNSIPVTGIALPFFSSGGTALVMQMVEMGIVLSVSRQSRTMKV